MGPEQLRAGPPPNLGFPAADFRRAAISWAAALLAGNAFTTYRARRGVRTSKLPDFFIGAHAAVEDLAPLTRDAHRYRTYSSTVELMAPWPAAPVGPLS